jgi:threonine synthase
MSAFQRAQMYSLQDANIFNIAVRGMFDDAQDIVKAVSNDHAFKARYKIGAVNSINWARVAAQVVYYFKGYFAGHPVERRAGRFAVPSGNFGNICAGHIARMMGLPIGRLVWRPTRTTCSTNSSAPVSIGRAVRRKRTTSSPSMDISKASNFERFVFDLVGRDPASFANCGRRSMPVAVSTSRRTPSLSDCRSFGFVSGKSTHADRLATIRSTVREVWRDGRYAHGRWSQGGAGAGAFFRICRCWCSRRRWRPSSKRRSSRRSGVGRNGRPRCSASRIAAAGGSDGCGCRRGQALHR